LTLKYNKKPQNFREKQLRTKQEYRVGGQAYHKRINKAMREREVSV